MSTINKKPFIAELVHGLQPEAITELYKCLNGQKEIQDLKLGSPRFDAFKTANHGVNHVLLEVDNLRKVPGYLIWNGVTFVFISYDNSKKLGQAEIDPVTFAINVIKEGLTVEELRRVLYDTIDVKEGVNETNVAAALAAMGLNVDALGKITEDEDGNINVPNIYLADTMSAQDEIPMGIDFAQLKRGDIVLNTDEDTVYIVQYIEEEQKIYLSGITAEGKPVICQLVFDDPHWKVGSITVTEPGAKLYKHEVLVETDRYITFVSDSFAPITDRYGILYNFCYPAFYSTSITARQINYYPIKEITFMASSYKVKIYYGGESSSVEVSASGYTDTVTQL